MCTVDPRLSRPRLSPDPELKLLHAYNDLRMRVVAVDKKVYMAAKSVVLSTEDRQVVGLLLSSTHCSQQLVLLALFTATGKCIWPIISLIRTFTYPA